VGRPQETIAFLSIKQVFSPAVPPGKRWGGRWKPRSDGRMAAVSQTRISMKKAIPEGMALKVQLPDYSGLLLVVVHAIFQLPTVQAGRGGAL
jgi:hypothetical protein